MMPRVVLPELMDRTDLERESHRAALRGLRRINFCTRGAAMAWQPIRRLAVELKIRQLRILDIATGAGDVPIGIWRRARRHGLDLRIEACDISPVALEMAAENCARAKAPVRLFPLDILSQSLDDRYDVVMCSLFLHHLSEEHAARLLRRMKALARHRVVIVDLQRGRANWLQVWLACHVLTRSPIVHHDGPQSIRAAFTVAEMAALARAAGFSLFTLERFWPCRFVFVAPTTGDG